MATYEVPLTPEPQRFTITLAGVDYTLAVRWRDAQDGGWYLDIANADGAALLSGVPLVTGVDLLGQHAHLGIGGALTVQGDVPTFADLGVGSRLYFVTP